MEGEKKKASSFGTSWADEVEREEEEAAARKQRIKSEEFEAETNKSRKPNPFGSARPREVVLQEKGVDWRKLDRDLEHNHSNLRNGKKLKENNMPLAPPIIRYDHFPLGSVCPKQKKPRPQNTIPLAPPLRYAPKNITALMEQIRRGRKDISVSATENSRRGKTRKNYIENTEIEPMSFPKEEHFVERCFVEEKRQVLVDLNMERADFGLHYGNCSAERRMSFAYGDQKLERTDYVKHYKDFNGDADRGGSSVGRGLKSTGYYGVRERTNPCNEGVDLRDAITLKRRLSTIQPASCHQRRQGKQSRKLDFK